MAHIVAINDTKGDIIDAVVYCSDWCAKTHKDYAGWSGCHELNITTGCEFCGATIEGVDG